MRLLTITSLLALCLFACEKNELTTLEDLRSEAVVWRLEGYSFSPGGGFDTIAIDNGRTLQFWDGRVQTNGSFCGLGGDIGPTEELDYDPVNQTITTTCNTDTSSYTRVWPYRIDAEGEYLSIANTWCVEGCWYLYRRTLE